MAVSVVALAGCSATKAIISSSGKSWTPSDLAVALASPSRPQADRDRDANRKPAETTVFFGVRQGMTVADLVASGGYMTEVLSIAVGPKGKVYAENPPQALKYRDGQYDKDLTQRLTGNRLPNVVRVDESLPTAAIPAGSVDVAVTAMNLHDIYNSMGPAVATSFLKGVYDILKPGGVLGVIDHVGVDGADNTKLHRMPKHQAIEVAQAAGFVVEEQSTLLAHSADDHTKFVFDPAVNGKTDQFVLRLRKPK